MKRKILPKTKVVCSQSKVVCDIGEKRESIRPVPSAEKRAQPDQNWPFFVPDWLIEKLLGCYCWLEHIGSGFWPNYS